MGIIPVKWRLSMADPSIDFLSFPAYIGRIPEKWLICGGESPACDDRFSFILA